LPEERRPWVEAVREPVLPTVKLENLPHRVQTKAAITQTFALANKEPAMAAAADANRPGVAR